MSSTVFIINTIDDVKEAVSVLTRLIKKSNRDHDVIFITNSPLAWPQIPTYTVNTIDDMKKAITKLTGLIEECNGSNDPEEHFDSFVDATLLDVTNYL